MAFRWGSNSPQKLRAAFQAQKRKMERERHGALGKAVSVFEEELKRRVYPARKINKQDAPGGRERSLSRRTPVRVKIDSGSRRAIVSILAHWTFARARGGESAVESVFRRVGQAEELQRKALIVKGKRLPFKRYPKLEKWAHRRDKGEQYRRHTVRIQSAKAMAILQMDPTVKRTAPKFKQIAQEAFRKGLRK